jgi:hypothetical protein
MKYEIKQNNGITRPPKIVFKTTNHKHNESKNASQSNGRVLGRSRHSTTMIKMTLNRGKKSKKRQKYQAKELSPHGNSEPRYLILFTYSVHQAGVQVSTMYEDSTTTERISPRGTVYVSREMSFTCQGRGDIAFDWVGRRMSFKDIAKGVYAAGTAMQCSDCGYSALKAIYSNRRVILEIASVEIQYVGAKDAEVEVEVEEEVQPSQRTRHFSVKDGDTSTHTHKRRHARHPARKHAIPIDGMDQINHGCGTML